jgi:hypothetical protein
LVSIRIGYDSAGAGVREAEEHGIQTGSRVDHGWIKQSAKGCGSEFLADSVVSPLRHPSISGEDFAFRTKRGLWKIHLAGLCWEDEECPRMDCQR